MSASRFELLQFPYSHYNEKARWALDWKRVAHVRRSLLPGPHAPTVRRLTGQTQVPVLCIDGRPVAGSAAILEELERRFPESPLYPESAALRTRALGLQAHFDDEVGPQVRGAVFSLLLPDADYVCRLFAARRSAPLRALYRSVFPLVRGVMRESMGIADPASIREAFAHTRAALDFVVKNLGPEGYLAGDRFSVADLTAAALLAPVANPPDSPMALPEPRPRPLVAWQDELRRHPAVGWVLEQYRKHRPPSAERPA